jgi:hypothetical protein
MLCKLPTQFNLAKQFTEKHQQELALTILILFYELGSSINSMG